MAIVKITDLFIIHLLPEIREVSFIVTGSKDRRR